MSQPDSLHALSCADDYDPNSMPVERARVYIDQFLQPLTTVEWLPIRDALDRVLAEDVRSPIDVPGHDNSAMDGWAFRAADLVREQPTTRLRRVGTAPAGQPFAGSVGPGECVRIFTGGLIPAGCDSVAQQEIVTVEGEGEAQQALIPSHLPLGANRRLRGEDLQAGAVALRRGQRVTPAALGLLASLGVIEVAVYRRLRVAVFSTGDELQGLGQPLAPGQLYDSNRHTLYGLLQRLGCTVLDLGRVPDDPSQLRAAFAAAGASADVVITSGGVSVGEADFVKPLLNELGEVLFWKIAMKPGRPLAYGRLGAAHFFGLPGNPVSVMATFYQIVQPALARLQGRLDYTPPPLLQATLTEPLKKAPGRTEYQRGILSAGERGYTVRSTGAQGSGMLSSMVQANCFIVLDTDIGNVPAGSTVAVQAFDGLI